MRRPEDVRPRRAPRQERSRATVEAILDAAARVLVRDGYEGATTNKIAEISGYGVGSLYDYFPNKDSLVVALIERHAREMEAAARSSFGSNADAPPTVAVRSWVEAGIEAHLANPALNEVLMGQTRKWGGVAPLREAEARVTRLVRLYLERHADELRPEDPALAGFVVAQAVISLTHEAVAKRARGLADGSLTGEVSDLVLAYLTNPEG